MNANEISNEEGLGRWLQERSQQDTVRIIFCSAMRDLPLAYGYLIDPDVGRMAFITALRCLVISSLSTAQIDSELRSLADQAARSAEKFFHEVDDPGHVFGGLISVEAANAVSAEPDDPYAFSTNALEAIGLSATWEATANNDWLWEQARLDAVEIETPSVAKAEIWRPNPIAVYGETLVAFSVLLESSPSPELPANYSDFWLKWINAHLDGSPPPFGEDLLRSVARIPTSDWEMGDLHINNTVIPELMRQHGVAAAVLVAEVKRNADGDFIEEPVSDLGADLFTDAKERVAEAIADFRKLMDRPQSYYGAFAEDIDRIEAQLERASNRPVRTYEKLADGMLAILDCARANGVTEDAQVKILLREMERSRRDIRADDPKIEAREAKRLRVGYDELLPDRQEDFRALISAGAAESEPGLKSEMEDDRASIEDPRTPAETRDRAVLRSTERLVQMDDIKRKEDAAKPDVAEKVAKRADQVTKVTKAGEGVWSIVSEIVTWLF